MPETTTTRSLRCSFCEEAVETLSDDNLCANCEENTMECEHCLQRVEIDNTNLTEHDGRVCDECLQEHYFTCEACDRVLHNNDYADDGRCDSCDSDSDSDNDENYLNIEVNNLDLECTEHQSDSKGQIIKDLRTFGVELECTYTSREQAKEMLKLAPKGFGFTHDGSISTMSRNEVGATEIVSPILKGKAGEKAIKTLCHLANNKGFQVNRSCGFHLHLGAEGFVRDETLDKERIDENAKQVDVKYKVVNPITMDEVMIFSQDPRCNLNEAGRFFSFDSHEIVQALYDENGNFRPEIKVEEIVTNLAPKKKVNRGESYFRLQLLFAFYSAFDDVFRAMMPKSRRNNHYCRSVDTLYSLDNISQCQDYSDIEALYYREKRQSAVNRRKQGGKYDDSRYCALNLHILFSKGKTIELRHHSPTLNVEKILRWVDLHQSIFKYVSQFEGDVGAEIAQYRIICAENTNVKEKVERLTNLVKLSDKTKEYVLSRIELFTGETPEPELKN